MKPSFKIVLLGEGRVGKTSLLRRYIHNTFHSDEPSTETGVHFQSRVVPIDSTVMTTLQGGGGSEGKMPEAVQLDLWDTAGQERFHALAPIYYRHSSGAVVVYDVGDRDTLSRARTWARELRSVCGESISIVLCGNKSDKDREREWDVTESEAKAVAAELRAQCVWTSAKTGVGVAEVFSLVAHLVLGEKLRTTSSSGGGVGDPNNSVGGGYATPARRAVPGTGTHSRHRTGPRRLQMALNEEEDDDFNMAPLQFGNTDGNNNNNNNSGRGGGGAPPSGRRVLLTESNPANNNNNNGDTGGGCC